MGSFLHQLTADRRAAAGVPGDRGEAGRPMVRGRPFGDRVAPGRLSTGAAEAKRWKCSKPKVMGHGCFKVTVT